ncbi:MAG: tyrosine-type recombinase/integrase [Bacillota bacterium]
MDNNPVNRVKLQPKPRTVRNIVLGDEEVRGFLKSQIAYRTVDAPTVYALKALLVFTGMRSSEIVNADWEHVDLQMGLLTVFDSKNSARKGLPENKDRNVPLCDYVLSSLSALPYREGPVLQSRRGRRLGTDALEEIVSRLSRAAGLKQDGRALTPHCFRHNLASQLVARGYSEADVAALLGHKPGTVTQGYIHSTLERLQEALQKYNDAITLGHSETGIQEPETPKGPAFVGSVDDVLKEAHRWWLLLNDDTPAPEPFLLGFVAGRRSVKAL